MANKFVIYPSNSRDHNGVRWRWTLESGDKTLCGSMESFTSVDEAKDNIKLMKKACTRYTTTEVRK